VNVCFIGYGSIAKRHINNLKSMYGDACEVDVLRHTDAGDADLKNVRNVFFDSNGLKGDYYAIFITNPTVKHYEALKEAVKHSKNIFIEKPVFEKYDMPLDELGLKKDGIYYVACPLRYTEIIRYIKENIDFNEVYSIRAISSSYLPEWRDTDYRQTYSARKELGGGVALDLIHEWDYITYLAGFPNTVKSLIAKKSGLDINTDDTALYIADYDDKTVEVHLDYYGREPVRRLELYGKDDTVIADFIGQKIEFLKRRRTVEFNDTRDDFQKRELKHFFEIINGDAENDSGIDHALKVVRIATGDWE